MSAEKLYQQVKSGKVKLDQLNDEGKKALKDYMATKNSEEPPKGPRQGTYPELQQFGRAALSVGKSLGGVAKKFGGDIKESVKDSAAKGREKKAAEKSKPFGHKVLGTVRGIGRDLKDFERGFYNTLTFGGTDAIEKNMGIASQEQIDRAKGSLAGKIGGFAGYVGPGGVADAAASALVRPLVRNAPKLVQGLTRLGTGGALFQGAIEGGEALRGEQQSLGGRALDIGFSGAVGGALGAAGPAAKGLLKWGSKKVGQALEGVQGNQMRAIESTMSPELPAAARQEVGQNPPAAPAVLNSTAGRQLQPIKLDEDVIKFNESGVGDADTFGSKISTRPAKKKGSVSKWWEKTRTELVDDLAPFEGFEKRVTGSVADAEDSLYKSARMFKGTPERAAQVVRERLSPIVKGIEKSGYAADDLGKYALAVHARDVNAAGIKSGFTNAEIEDVIRKLGTPEMEAARKELIQINRDMMNENVAAGNVSNELASLLEERWKNYIPLFRDMDDEAVDFATGLSNALANVADPIKALKGSEKKVIDPLENMVKNIFQSINSAERNKVASKLHRLNEIDTDNNFIRKLGEGEDVGRKNVVNVRVNGDNVKYEVEPEVYKAMLNLDQESSNMITNILSKPAALLRAGATLTPEFSLRNPMRDVVQAFVVSKSGFNPITDFGAGLIQTISKGRLYKDWIDNLGAYGNVMSMDRNVHRQALEKVLKQPLSKKFVNIVSGKSLIRALRYITDTTESATKVGEYRAALRKGVSKQEAAYRSRDIMDFARAGSGVRQANKMVAFLNANIQGKSKLIRAIKENPAGTITRAFTAVTVPTVGIYVLNKQFANDTQRETIDNAPDWMRNSFWLMAIPGTDVVARIPKPFDLAAIFSNLPERALDFAYDNDKEAFDGFVSRTLKESALPMQISGLIPFIEGMANYSFFREGDIIPQRESGLEYKDQYDPVRTTETGKFLAKGAELLTGGKGAFKNFSSPRVMDNTIQGLTAGLGKYGTDAIDFILQKTGAVDRPVAPEKSIEQKPFAKAFLVDPNQGGKEMDEFYSTIDKLSKEKSSNKLNDESFGKTGKTTDYLPWDKNSLLKDLNAASDDVSDINKEIRAIEKDTLLNAHQKKMKIDRLISDRKNIVKESVKLIK